MIEDLLRKFSSCNISVHLLSQNSPDWWSAELRQPQGEAVCIGYGSGPSAYYALLAASQHLEAAHIELKDKLRLAETHYAARPAGAADKRAGEALLAKLGLGKAKPQVSIL